MIFEKTTYSKYMYCLGQYIFKMRFFEIFGHFRSENSGNDAPTPRLTRLIENDVWLRVL